MAVEPLTRAIPIFGGGELSGIGETLSGRIISTAGEVARVDGEENGLSGSRDPLEDGGSVGGVAMLRVDEELPNRKAAPATPLTPFVPSLTSCARSRYLDGPLVDGSVSDSE